GREMAHVCRRASGTVARRQGVGRRWGWCGCRSHWRRGGCGRSLWCPRGARSGQVRRAGFLVRLPHLGFGLLIGLIAAETPVDLQFGRTFLVILPPAIWPCVHTRGQLHGPCGSLLLSGEAPWEVPWPPPSPHRQPLDLPPGDFGVAIWLCPREIDPAGPMAHLDLLREGHAEPFTGIARLVIHD